MSTTSKTILTKDGIGEICQKMDTGYLVWIRLSNRYRALRFYTFKEVKL